MIVEDLRENFLAIQKLVKETFLVRFSVFLADVLGNFFDFLEVLHVREFFELMENIATQNRLVPDATDRLGAVVIRARRERGVVRTKVQVGGVLSERSRAVEEEMRFGFPKKGRTGNGARGDE